MFDGVVSHVGGQSSGSMFETYNPSVISRLGITSPLLMDAVYTIVGNTATVSVTIEVDQTVTTAQNQVYFVATEDEGHNQVNLARAMVEPIPFSLQTVGETVTLTRDFELDAEWVPANMAFVVFVQSYSSHDVLQSALATADYAATIVVDCEPSGLNAPWQLTGPNGFDHSGNGDHSLPVFTAGEYTLVWTDMAGWTTPATNPIVQTVPEEGLVTFAGFYTDGPFAALTAGPLGDTGAGRGVNIIDYDEDGHLDIYVVNYNGPNRLLHSDGVGGYTDVASGDLADSGPDHAAAWADFDRDGDLDLYLSRDGAANFLLENDGGVFTDIASPDMANDGPGRAVAWADVDNDGWLDLHLVNFDTANRLFKNYGDFGGDIVYFFPLAGIIEDDGPGTGTAWCDYDADGDQDVFLTNRFAANVLFEYYNGQFLDSNESPSGNLNGGAGAAWGDFDNDGDFDCYLANDGGPDVLYRRTSGGFSTQSGDHLGDLGHGRGVVWVDLDNDTYLDLYVARHGESDLLLQNNGDGSFTRVMVGWDEADGPSSAVASGDLDSDGRVDLYVTREGLSNVLLGNERSNANHWLQVRLTGVEASSNGVSATVRVTAGGVTQIRMISAGSGYCSQNSFVAAFGLGSATSAESVEVTWPDGEVQLVSGVAADQVLHLTEGEVVDGVGDETPAPSLSVLRPAYPNPFNPKTTVSYSLATTGRARLDVFTVNGQRVATLVDDIQRAGDHEVTWTGVDDAGRQLASGAYFFRLTAADVTRTERALLVK